MIFNVSKSKLEKGNLTKDEIISLLNTNQNDIIDLMAIANSKRENNNITYSKIFYSFN